VHSSDKANTYCAVSSVWQVQRHRSQNGTRTHTEDTGSSEQTHLKACDTCRGALRVTHIASAARHSLARSEMPGFRNGSQDLSNSTSSAFQQKDELLDLAEAHTTHTPQRSKSTKACADLLLVEMSDTEFDVVRFVVGSQ